MIDLKCVKCYVTQKEKWNTKISIFRCYIVIEWQPRFIKGKANKAEGSTVVQAFFFEFRIRLLLCFYRLFNKKVLKKQHAGNAAEECLK